VRQSVAGGTPCPTKLAGDKIAFPTKA
jgi:hypothetical protein